MACSSFVVAQLTDIHYFSEPDGQLFNVNTTETLQRVLTSVRECSLDPKFVLATGDLVHDEGEQAYRRLDNDLSGLGLPIYGLPGNHDVATALNSQAWSSMQFPFRVAQGAWQFFMMNTQVKDEVGGFLDRDQLAALEQDLADNSDTFAAICLHHHPVAVGSRWLDRIALGNADDLFAIIARFPNIKLVIWGHVHQEWDEIRAGVRLLGTPSTCAQFLPEQNNFALDTRPPGWRWLRFFDDGTIETAVVWAK